MTYALKATVNVGSDPIPILYSNGSIWVGNFGSDSVSRIDPASNTVIATISSYGFIQQPVSLAEDNFGNVWVANGNAGVARIDPATNTVTASLYTSNGYKPYGIGMGAGEMWISFSAGSGEFRRFNTTTLAETYRSPGSEGYGYNVVDDGTNVWFDNGFVCNKIDPATNARTAIFTSIVAGLGFLHYAFGYIWRVTGSGIQRVDPSTNALTTITLSGVAVFGITDDGSNLVVSDIGGELYVVDPTSFTVKQTLTSTSYYWSTTFGGGSIWVNARFSSQCKRFSPLPVGWVRGHAWG